MSPARAYAAVALRRAWADLLLRLRLRRQAADAYDEALIRAFALSLDFEPATPAIWSCQHMTATVTEGSLRGPWRCWHGCQMTPQAGTRTS